MLKKGFFFLALAFATMPAFSQSKLLVGSWRLTTPDKTLPNGSQVAVYGTNPGSIVIFTAHGHYVATGISSKDVMVCFQEKIKRVHGNGLNN